MNKTINWGIIGVGNVCEVKSGPAFYKIENSALTAVMRRDEAKLIDFATRHNVSKWYTNAEELINDPNVDAVYIATPPNMHKEYAIMAMSKGKPAYVEKPMGMHYSDCKEMIDASIKNNQKLFVAFYRRALPYFLKIKSLLEENTIGKILTVNVRHYKAPRSVDLTPDTHSWHLDKKIAGDGYFYDLAPHTLDILDFLFGEIEEAKGYAQNLGGLYDVSDTISATFKFKSGVLGTAQWCFVASQWAAEDIVEVVGVDGKISFGIFSFTPIALVKSNATTKFDLLPPEHIQQPLIQMIVDELRGVGQCPSTGITGARTSRVMDWILGYT